MIELIAEIGWNHNGDMSIAKKMISEAKKAGATYAKFQTWSESRLKPGPWDNDGRREIYKKAQLTKGQHVDLIDYCNEVGIKFLSSTFSIEDSNLLLDLGVREVKIPSFESRNRDLFLHAIGNFDRVIMSTGTSTIDEIGNTVKGHFNFSKLVLLHCVSTYPGKFEEANLGKMALLKRYFTKNVGFSDHIQSPLSSMIAIAEGATWIEKHFTIDHEFPGRDNKFALLPDEFKQIADFIQLREIMNTGDPYSYQKSEKESREIYTGRFNG